MIMAKKKMSRDHDMESMPLILLFWMNCLTENVSLRDEVL
jgi:hypothetical protein